MAILFLSLTRIMIDFAGPRAFLIRAVLVFNFDAYGPHTGPFILFAISTSPIIHLVCSKKFCIIIVSSFSWDDCNNQEKWETKEMEDLGGKQDVSWGIWKCEMVSGAIRVI